MKIAKFTLFLISLLPYFLSHAQITTQYRPDGHVEIGEGVGGFLGGVDPGDRFSRDHDQAGDINGDGILDLVVGARSDDDGATDAGAVYILFLNNDGTVQSNQKISMLEGGFMETLNPGNFFGYGVAGIGDYDNDGIPDIAVSAPAPPNNSLYIIHLNADGTVKDYVKNQDIIANGLTAIGDLNNDGRIDLVTCNHRSNDGGTNRGAISLTFLDGNSQVIPQSTVTISSTQGGFGTGLSDGDEFGGREAAMLGDIDGDGTKELAVGAFKSDGGKGAVWILSLDTINFQVSSKIKITEGLNGFTDTLTLGSNPNGSTGANFGHSMCAPGDLNGDGIPDLITGANQQNEGWAYILFLNADRTVKTYSKINNTDGGFDLQFDPEERFSRSISFIGDLRGDGTLAVNIGGGATGIGTLYLLFFNPCDFFLEPGNNFHTQGNTLFTNWNHGTQTVTGPLTFEQCASKVFETEAKFMTFNPMDGRCICKDSTAFLAVSTEQSFAYSNMCYDGLIVSVPVELHSFSATNLDCSKTDLTWSTASELNNKHFILERSFDAKDWAPIATIAGRGTTSKEVLYTYEDKLFKHHSAKVYYRLKQVDFNESSSLSRVVALDLDCSDPKVSIVPNPIENMASITGIEEINDLVIYNIAGVALSFAFDKDRNEIDLSGFSQGIYLASMRMKNGEVKVLKLIKQ